MPIPLSLRVPLPLRPTFSWTAVTTIFASPTSNSQPPCKTDMTTPSDLNLWTLNTGQTQTHMHAQLNQRNYVCYSSHNEQSLHCIAHIIVPFTMWCVRAFLCTCMCVCVWISLLSVEFPAVRYLHGSIIQTSCHPLLTDTHTHAHIVGVIVGVGGIAFQAAEQISHEPVLKIINWIYKNHKTGVGDSCTELLPSVFLCSSMTGMISFPCAL